MRINHPPDMDDIPPPPYTPHNPSIGNGEVPVLSQDAGSLPYQPTLRGGYTRPSLPSESHISSAATYFEDRQPYLHNAGIHLNLIEHNITITPETTRKDLIFPLPIETYIARDVTSLDWSTFVNYLFPLPTQPTSEKPRREKDHKPHSFAEEDTPERRSHIEAVVTDWNESFFSPRLIHVNIEFARPSSSSSRSTARPTSTLGITPSETSLDRDFSQPETRYTLPPKNDFSTQRRHRSHSQSSTSSSSSSSSSASSIDSIRSKDLEGADINTIRSALLAFRLDTANKNHLRGAIHNLRNEFISFRDRSDLKNKSKEQRKEVKKEVKAVIKEVKAARKADRKLHKAERKSRRDGKRAERRGHHHHERYLRKQDRAEEKAMRTQERSARTTASISSAHATAAEARARSWESETAARTHAQEVTERAQATANAAQNRAAGGGGGGNGNWGDAGREKARLAETRAQETARNYTSRNWGGDATARAQETARNYTSRNWGGDATARAQQTAHNASSQNWGSYGRERAREAQACARNVSGQDWGRYGRERGREAEGRAREAARWPGGRQEMQEPDGEQESGVLG